MSKHTLILPKDDRELRALLSRSGALKRRVMEFMLETFGEQEVFRKLSQPGVGIVASEEDLVLAQENFFAFHRHEGRSVIDLFLERHETTAEERALLTGWKADRIEGVFLPLDVHDLYVRAKNLVDELDYTIYRTLFDQPQADGFRSPDTFFVTGIAPLGEHWMFSGVSKLFHGRDVAYGFAMQLAMRYPHLRFRNPALLAEGRRLDREMAERFREKYGHWWIHGRPRAIWASYLDLVQANQRMPENLASAQTLCVACHPERGVYLLPDFHLFLEALEVPEQMAKKHHDYLDALLANHLPAVMLIALHEERPEAVTALLGYHLQNSGQTFEEMIAPYWDEEPEESPTRIPFSDEYEKGYHLLSKAMVPEAAHSKSRKPSRPTRTHRKRKKRKRRGKKNRR